MSAPSEDGDDRVVEEIYDALDAGAPERAYAAARIALTRSPDDPVLHFLAGTALLDLDQPEDAAAALARAVTLDPEDAEFRAMHAQALFAACAFGRARAEAERAVAIDQASADGRYVRAMVLEREGRQDEADREYREASRLAPDRLTMPTRMTRDAFEEAVARAAAILPREFRDRLDSSRRIPRSIPSCSGCSSAPRCRSGRSPRPASSPRRGSCSSSAISRGSPPTAPSSSARSPARSITSSRTTSGSPRTRWRTSTWTSSSARPRPRRPRSARASRTGPAA